MAAWIKDAEVAADGSLIISWDADHDDWRDALAFLKDRVPSHEREYWEETHQWVIHEGYLGALLGVFENAGEVLDVCVHVGDGYQRRQL